MAKRVFYAAKVNVHAHIFSQNLQELISFHIPRVILEAPSIKVNSFNWSFTDTKELFHDNHRIIIGNVTRSKHTNQKVKIGHKTDKIRSEYEIARTAFFVYHPESEILVHEVNSSIPDDAFRIFFTKLLSRDPYIGDVVIKAIPEPRKIRDEILMMNVVTDLHFNLIHPNPGKPEHNLYQQLIREQKLKELEIRMSNKLEGIKLTDNDFDLDGNVKFSENIESGINLVESGYGTVDVRGFNPQIIEGKKKQLVRKKPLFFTSRKSIRMIKTIDYDENRLRSRIVSFILDIKNKIRKLGERDDFLGF